MLEALEKTHGNVLYSAQLAGIERRTHYHWIEKDPEYARKAAESRVASLDIAEGVVHAAMAKQEDRPELALKAAIFLLENQGGARGYGRQGTNVQVNTQVNTKQDITLEQWRAMTKKAVEASQDKGEG